MRRTVQHLCVEWNFKYEDLILYGRDSTVNGRSIWY